jgi:Polyketide cyclase / dehydrase and lipid transport
MARQTSITASAIIPAPPDRVWQVACDTSRYPEWVENTLRMTRTDRPTRPGATYEELSRIAGPWKSVTRWRVTEFDPPRRQVQQGEGVSTAKNMAVIIELSPPDRTPISPSPSPTRRGSGRPARSSTGPSEGPLLVPSSDRHERSPHLPPAGTQTPDPAMTTAARPALRGDRSAPGLLRTRPGGQIRPPRAPGLPAELAPPCSHQRSLSRLCQIQASMRAKCILDCVLN